VQNLVAVALPEAAETAPGTDTATDEQVADRPSSAEADERVDDEPPWRRGRAGTAIGRAVHAVLQTIDLATGDGATALAAAQAAAEGVPDLATVIEQRVRSVLESPSVEAAVATGKYWREVFVAVPVGERVLEGFIDLLYEDADGELVVVDYKTDGVRNEADADEAVGRYRLQAAAYALAVSHSLSRPVSRCVFVFANPTRWFERELSDLANARGEVETLLTSG
jgi:ATP-dependent exoDNAse (exonuclease V) beta subunit